MSEFTLRPGADGDIADCVGLWTRASDARDGAAVPGVAERAARKFDHRVVWLIAEADGPIRGFVLATSAGSGAAADPADAAVLGLLAVDPAAQRSGLGRRLLVAATSDLRRQRYERVVLHVLADNTAAVRLYESEGWRPLGPPVDHTLLHRPAQTYSLELQDSPPPAGAGVEGG